MLSVSHLMKPEISINFLTKFTVDFAVKRKTLNISKTIQFFQIIVNYFMQAFKSRIESFSNIQDVFAFYL